MKKKILIIAPGMEIGGVERSLLGLLDSIDYTRFDVSLFLLSHSGELMPYINGNARQLPEEALYALAARPILSLFKESHFFVGSVRIAAKLLGAARSRLSGRASVNTSLCNRILTSFVKRDPIQYDIALGFFAPHFYLEKKVSAKVKVGWVHTDYTKENYDRGFFAAMWAKLDYIAAVSDGVSESVRLMYPKLDGKLVAVENILDADFVRRQAEAFDVHSEMPTDGAVRLLSVGRYCTAKAFDEAVVACRKLVDEGLNIRWYFIGYGPDEELIRRAIRENDMADRAILLGKKDNPYPYMKACDLYVQPSRYEGKAVTVREAQMLGKPVMITRFATSASQLQEGVDGYICEMGVDGVVTGVKYLLAHPEVMTAISAKAAQSDYSNRTEVEKITSLM